MSVLNDAVGGERPPAQQGGSNASRKAEGVTSLQSTSLQAAETYIRAGCHVFPGKRRQKTPRTGWSWTKDKLSLDDAQKYFGQDQHNVLVALGDASNDVVDIDLDWVEAAAAADLLMRDLPSFGRSGKPRSHRLAISRGVKTQKYLLPQSLANHPKIGGEHAMCVAEVRSSGSYTVFPGSQHESGKQVEWTNADADNLDALRVIDEQSLLKITPLVVFVAFCMRFFPAVGTRCDFMMALAGSLAHAGYQGDFIQHATRGV